MCKLYIFSILYDQVGITVKFKKALLLNWKTNSGHSISKSENRRVDFFLMANLGLDSCGKFLKSLSPCCSSVRWEGVRDKHTELWCRSFQRGKTHSNSVTLLSHLNATVRECFFYKCHFHVHCDEETFASRKRKGMSALCLSSSTSRIQRWEL